MLIFLAMFFVAVIVGVVIIERRNRKKEGIEVENEVEVEDLSL